ncbi:hypothetical protein MMC22_008993 [Lobaria immixta]|nr:hypothetical protein [Lobaria immixta]
MSYFQSLVDLISICIWCVKIILLNFLVAFLIHYVLTNGFQVFRGISGFLWKRRTDAKEKAEQLEWLHRKQLLYDFSQHEVERRKEEDEVCRSAEILRRRIRSREAEEENIAKRAKLAERLAQEEELEWLSQKLAKKRDEEEQLQLARQKLSRDIARKREEQEELKYERERLLQKMAMIAIFHEQSWEEKLKEAVRKQEEEEELRCKKEILARGNERRMALEEQRRTAIENERSIAAQEERMRAMEAEPEYRWDGLDWGGPQPDVELGLDSTSMV